MGFFQALPYQTQKMRRKLRKKFERRIGVET